MQESEGNKEENDLKSIFRSYVSINMLLSVFLDFFCGGGFLKF